MRINAKILLTQNKSNRLKQFVLQWKWQCECILLNLYTYLYCLLCYRLSVQNDVRRYWDAFLLLTITPRNFYDGIFDALQAILYIEMLKLVYGVICVLQWKLTMSCFLWKAKFFIIYVKQPHPFFIANAYNFTKMHDIILVSPITCTTTTYLHFCFYSYTKLLLKRMEFYLEYWLQFDYFEITKIAFNF